MFKNIEKTIKIMAKILFFVALAAGVVMTFVAFAGEDYMLPIGIGSILGAFFFLPMYGFGVLLEYVKDMHDNK